MATAYIRMLRQADQDISLRYFVLAGFFSWLLLAGFLISPSTFSSTGNLDLLNKSGQVGQQVVGAVRNVPLLYIAALASLSATVGLGWLWWRWRHNFIWVNRYLVLPTLIHSAMGFASTLLGVYSLQHGQWSITAQITAGIISFWLTFTAFLYLYFEYIVLAQIRR